MKVGESIMKKVFKLFLCFIAILMVTGCGSKSANIEGKLEDLMAKVYDGISEEKLPMMLQNIELTEEDIEYYIGTKDIKWKEAIASESGIGSIAHSVVLIRMSEDANDKDIEDAKSKIKENANPRKWLCVEAENVFVENKGNLIILIMSDDKAETLKTNFEELK